jgi:hypothetical protein
MLYSHYGIHTTSPYYLEVISWAQRHNLKIFPHLNRARFFIPDAGILHTEFMLRWASHCHEIHKNQDLATGLPLGQINR